MELWGQLGHQLWLWVALYRRTRQIVGWTLGDRSLQSADDLRASLPKGYRGRATHRDDWDAYTAAFPKKTHRCCGKADGQTCHVEHWFGTLRARTLHQQLPMRTPSNIASASSHVPTRVPTQFSE